MNSLVLLLVGLVPLALADHSQFIVGGYDASIANHPYQGSFRMYNQHMCGCVLVASTWVISAAHCGGSTNGYYELSFGATDRRYGTVVMPRRVTLHPQYGYGYGSFPNDISVIELQSPVSGNYITPIALGQNRLMGTERAIITGWGKTCGACGSPITLQAVELDVLTDSECSRYWGNGYNSQTHVCVMDRYRNALGSCSGDSGGPMKSGNAVHGVTSYGEANCSPSYPSVYSRVSSFRPWICGVSGNRALGC